MLKIDRITKNELIQRMHSEEKSHQTSKGSLKKHGNRTRLLQEINKKCDSDARKRDFVKRVYRDLGYVCEV